MVGAGVLYLSPAGSRHWPAPTRSAGGCWGFRPGSTFPASFLMPWLLGVVEGTFCSCSRQLSVAPNKSVAVTSLPGDKVMMGTRLQGGLDQVPDSCSATGGCVMLSKLLVCSGPPSPLLCKGDSIASQGDCGSI